MNANEAAQLAQQAMQYRQARNASAGDHVSLGGPLRAAVFAVIWLFVSGLGAIVAIAHGGVTAPLYAGGGIFAGVFLAAWLHRIPRVAAQWERGVVLRLGKFHGLRGPGLILVYPIVDTIRFVDTRLLTLDVPHQQVITKDNVPVNVDGVIFFLVQDVERATIAVQDYRYAISQYAQAALRDVIGGMTLDDLLAERDHIQEQITNVIEARAKAWGIHVDSIRLLDINMPEDLKRMMSRQASAEREKRATITKAEGDKDAAKNLAEAAATMGASPGAMQLRTLQSLDGLGSSPSNTVILAVPVEVLELAKSLSRPRTVS